MLRWLRRWGPPLLVAVVAVAAATDGTARADKEAAGGDGPLERKALNEIVFKTFRDVINKGADLYNSGDWAGCYRLYEGALMTARPLLDHKPGLQKDIDAALVEAGRTPALHERAFVLRKVIDKVRADVNPNPNVAPPPKTVWERLGGEKTVTKVVRDFVEAAANDKKVNFFRTPEIAKTFNQEKIEALQKSLVDFISDKTGGPRKYMGKSMKEAHAGMKITDAEFDALVGHIKAALKKNGVNEADAAVVLDAVEKTRKDIVEGKEEPKETSLYERLGKKEGIAKVVDDVFTTAAEDKKVNFFRGAQPKEGEVPALKKKLIDWIGEKTGGPEKYTGKSMKDVHKGLKITDAEFDALVGHIEAALKKNGVKADDVKTILGVVEKTRADVVEPKEEAKGPEDATVKGKVTFKDKPVGDGIVTFHADGKAFGPVNIKDGTYEVPKLKPGKYTVTVESKVGDLGLLPKKYADAKTSPLIVEAKAGENKFDLTPEPDK
jgi:hemoglobin